MSSSESAPLLGPNPSDRRGRSQTTPVLSSYGIREDASTNNSEPNVVVLGWPGLPIDDEVDNGASPVNNPPVTGVYSIRWYLLFLLSMNGFVQGLIWNTFGPISETCEIVFGWDNTDIALIANWGCISFFIALFPFNYVIEKWGLRASLLLALFGTFFGTTVRLLPVQRDYVRYTMHVGQFLAGLGGPVSMAVPPIFSATWFPPKQRTTATAIGALLNLLGIALSFFVGPLFVREVPTMANVTVDSFAFQNLTNATSLQPFREDIFNLMWFEWALITTLTVAACVYFPNRPRLPPSLSASQPKGSLLAGLLNIIKIPNFWLVALPYGLCAGCFSTYGTQLNSIFHKFGVTQDDAGHLGLYYSTAGILASFIMAFTADRFAGHFKLFLLTLTIFMTGLFSWICLMYNEVLPMKTTHLYIAFIAYAVCQTSTIPLYYEATIETVYPISDSIASCMLTLINNVCGAAYLLIMGIKGIGVAWSNWAILGVTAIGIPLLFCFRQSYSRLDIDNSSRRNADMNETGSYARIDSLPY